MGESIIVALIAAIGGLIGTYFANRKVMALIEYRLGEVEKKLDHQVKQDDRISALETATEVHAAELHRHNERLKTLEAKP